MLICNPELSDGYVCAGKFYEYLAQIKDFSDIVTCKKLSNTYCILKKNIWKKAIHYIMMEMLKWLLLKILKCMAINLQAFLDILKTNYQWPWKNMYNIKTLRWKWLWMNMYNIKMDYKKCLCSRINHYCDFKVWIQKE